MGVRVRFDVGYHTRIVNTETLVTHANAPLSETGRLRLAKLVVDSRWPLRRAAERFSCSPATAKKWADRYRVAGSAGMHDVSSRPLFSPTRTRRRTERRIVALRFARRWGSHRIAWHLHLSRSTVENVLRRYRMPLLTHIDKATGLPVRRPQPVRYEHEHPGDLVHVDVKKLGRIPDGGGHRVMSRQQGQANRKTTRPGTRSCTTPSTTIPGWRTRRSSTTSVRRPRRRSGCVPVRSSPSTASPCSG
jgi:hypothetical protein